MGEALVKWASAASDQKDFDRAVHDCATAVKSQLAGAKPDFAAAFVSAGFAENYQDLPRLLADQLPVPVFTGCSAGGVLGAGREIEHKPGLSLVAASLPGVVLKAFAFQDEELPSPDASPRAWETLVGARPAEDPQFLLLADPFSLRADNAVMGLDYAFPKSVKVGGLASGARGPGENALYLNGACHRSGAVGVAFTGDIAVDALVAQGCKPIGAAMTVTDCRENILLSLDGRPPLRALEDLIEGLAPRDRELVRHSLFLGLVMDPLKQRHERGDFLIRNIVGADMQKGILAVGALLRKGQTVQFHLRDAETSAEDLKAMLARHSPQKDRTRGALLFSCLGRGEHLYGAPDHDSKMFHDAMGAVPLAGFFCNGEIGPVGGTTYLHGYTSCFGLFRPKN